MVLVPFGLYCEVLSQMNTTHVGVLTQSVHADIEQPQLRGPGLRKQVRPYSLSIVMLAVTSTLCGSIDHGHSAVSALVATVGVITDLSVITESKL